MSVLTAWQDPGCPIPVDYSREAMEQIRRLAVDGLLQLPRIGVGVGGLLLGTRLNGRITILDSMVIPCSHAEGPSFRLTAEEIERANEMAHSAGPLTVIGWYCSKTRLPAALTEGDLTLFGSLCPEAWQMTLLIRPSTVEASHVALCFRGAAGRAVQGAEYPLKPFTEVRVQSEPAAAPEPEVVKPVVTKPVVTKADVRKIEIPAAAEAPSFRTEPPATGHPAPLFQSAIPPSAARWRMKLAGWALVASAIIAGTGAAFFMHPDWISTQPLRLTASDANGHLTIRWNPGSVRGIDHASLTFNDGGEPHTIELDSRQLDAGTAGYDRRSAHVDALMQAGSLRAQVSFPQ
jgi:hypothetical protein